MSTHAVRPLAVSFESHDVYGNARLVSLDESGVTVDTCHRERSDSGAWVQRVVASQTHPASSREAVTIALWASNGLEGTARDQRIARALEDVYRAAQPGARA